MTEAVLEVSNLTTRYGGFIAVDDVSLRVERGSITGLIGPNGAGKSTLFNTIAGTTRANGGQVTLMGRRIDGLSPDRIFRLGLARTFQIPRPFAQMTVLENLMLAAPRQRGEAFWAPLLTPGRIATLDAQIRAKAQEVLAFTTLDRVAEEAAGLLSGGQQKLLELARVLMGDPQVILLDEPAAGVNPALMGLLIEKIEALNAAGVTFLLIEHNMDIVMSRCDPIIALAEGQVIFRGTAAEAAANARLLDAYLGAPLHG